MSNTSSIISILVVLAMIATASALVLGVIGMFVQGPSHHLKSNRLMRVRILCQGLALLLFALLMMLS